MRWCQVGVKRSRFHVIDVQNTCKTAVSRSGTPYEQDPEHRLSLDPRQLYSLDTVFGKQGVEPDPSCSMKSGGLYQEIRD
jgi:hypothetical protein